MSKRITTGPLLSTILLSKAAWQSSDSQTGGAGYRLSIVCHPSNLSLNMTSSVLPSNNKARWCVGSHESKYKFEKSIRGQQETNDPQQLLWNRITCEPLGRFSCLTRQNEAPATSYSKNTVLDR